MAPKTKKSVAVQRSSARSSVPPRDLVTCRNEIKVFEEEWKEMWCLKSVHKRGDDVIGYLKQAIENLGRDRTNQIRAPSEQGTLSELFRTPPELQHFVHELLRSVETVVYFNSNTFEQDDSVDEHRFLGSFAQRFDQRYKPLTATQTRLLEHPGGLRACGPRTPKVDMFPGFGLSSSVVFQEHNEVSICNEGAFLPPHIAYSSIGTMHTLVEYDMAFVTWPPTDKNLGLMQVWHLKKSSWDDALAGTTLST